LDSDSDKPPALLPVLAEDRLRNDGSSLELTVVLLELEL
jgi:hypothetical protein